MPRYQDSGLGNGMNTISPELIQVDAARRYHDTWALGAC